MQLDGGRRGGTQHILEWGVFGLILGGEAGVLLLEDRQSEHIAETQRETKKQKRQMILRMPCREERRKSIIREYLWKFSMGGNKNKAAFNAPGFSMLWLII